MAASFAGFVVGSVPGLQQFGLGLAFAVLIDATIVRTLLVPSLMAPRPVELVAASIPSILAPCTSSRGRLNET
jgi:hypothetical protein